MFFINLSSSDFAIGDHYAQALAEGLLAFDCPTSIVLKGSNLSDIGAIPIFNSLKRDLIILDLSNNPRISHNAFLSLFEIIDTKLLK